MERMVITMKHTTPTAILVFKGEKGHKAYCKMRNSKTVYDNKKALKAAKKELKIQGMHV